MPPRATQHTSVVLRILSDGTCVHQKRLAETPNVASGLGSGGVEPCESF